MAMLATAPNAQTPIFDQAEWDKAFPGGWADSARASKSSYLMDQENKLTQQGQSEANRLNAEEESRGKKMEDIVRSALPEANAPTMTDLDVRRAMTDKTDEAARRTNASMSLLRSQLGGAGEIGGGRAAGVASNIALAKSGQVTDARRGLFLEVSKSKALDRARNFQNDLTLANAVNRPVSQINMDWIGQMLGINMAKQGSEAQRSAAKDAANAAKTAGYMSLAGNLGGALIGKL